MSRRLALVLAAVVLVVPVFVVGGGSVPAVAAAPGSSTQGVQSCARAVTVLASKQ